MTLDYETGIPGFSGIVHFVGIGGIGMSGIAEILVNLGFRVQGSDIVETATLKHLRNLGVQVFIGHKPENVQNAAVVVVTSAIRLSNPEVHAAGKLRIPVIKRAEMLAELMRFRYGIAVAGTHGKTTTTSLIAALLSRAGLDPTYVVGGKVADFGGSAGLGGSRYLVVEADESDASFLHLKPMMVVVTNVDSDHLAAYDNNFQQLAYGFAEFIENSPFYGTAVVCNEDVVLRRLQKAVPRRFLTYGFTRGGDIRASKVKLQKTGSMFDLSVPWREDVLEIRLNLLGKHNVLNALAAIGVAHEVGVDDDVISDALAGFRGISRRFQNHGEVAARCGNVLIIDDYAHHPTEIAATYKAACAAWPRRRKIIIFEPHRYSRLYALFDLFSEVLSRTDCLLLLDVYPAGERLMPGIDSLALCRAIRARGGDPVYVKRPEDVFSALSPILKKNDIVITMGAGSVGSLAKQLVQQLHDEA